MMPRSIACFVSFTPTFVPCFRLRSCIMLFSLCQTTLAHMTGGPITALIMHPVVKEELLADAHLQRLERSCRLVDPTPFRNFDGLGQEAGRVQVLITSWGCPRIDRSVV